MINPVRSLAFKIIKKAKHVKINKEKIKEFSKQRLASPEWNSFYHFGSLDYFFVLDSINFCFWNKDKKWEITYKGKKHDGYFALALALKIFFEKKSPDMGYFSSISLKEFCSILQGGKNLYFLKKRWQIIKQVSSEIIRKYGTCQDLVKNCNNKFSALVPKIENLPYFKDPFLKRAQILACDIYGSGLEKFDDLDYLTAFADYKVPQILNHLGILEYSESLNKKIKNKALIAPGSLLEMEIRAGTIIAIESIKKDFGFYAFEIDWILWNKAQKLNIKKPYHLTKTICY